LEAGAKDHRTLQEFSVKYFLPSSQVSLPVNMLGGEADDSVGLLMELLSLRVMQ
jgi:hypothetical protein